MVTNLLQFINLFVIIISNLHTGVFFYEVFVLNLHHIHPTKFCRAGYDDAGTRWRARRKWRADFARCWLGLLHSVQHHLDCQTLLTLAAGPQESRHHLMSILSCESTKSDQSPLQSSHLLNVHNEEEDGTIQGAIEAFGEGNRYPDYIKTFATISIGAGGGGGNCSGQQSSRDTD